MDWMPNLEGVRWFLKQVWPKVHERMPQLTLYLAGRKMPKDLMQLETEGVRVLGEVPDAMYFIASKQINVVPLLSGSGMRVKIIEAMSAGKAVVTTTIGAAGIGCKDGENVLIADTPEQFVEQLQRCVDDPEYRRQIGCNAARLIVDQYGNEQLTRRLIGFYEQILNRD
jgi:glycosyltransferase involved in cell wall biosynthesis